MDMSGTSKIILVHYIVHALASLENLSNYIIDDTSKISTMHFLYN